MDRIVRDIRIVLHQMVLVALSLTLLIIIKCEAAGSQSVFIIEDLVRGKQIKTHVHNLRPFLFNPAQVNPQDIAQQNEQEFIVGEILAHRGNHQRRSTMEFLVRWAGYDETSNSWEPYKALMHADRLHEYLREHRMRSLIPKGHK